MRKATTEDIILHLFDEYLTDDERDALAKEIEASPEAKKQVRKLKKDIDEMLKNNKKERIRILDNMPDYLEGKITSLDGVPFKTLLEEHEECKYICQKLKRQPSLAELEALDVPVPPTLHQRIDNFLIERRKQGSPQQSIHGKVEKIIDSIKLVLAPLPKATPAFLSDKITGAAEIDLSGRKLEVDVGKSSLSVKVFSMQDEELHRRLSDKAGKAVFDDLERGKYKIVVEGFEIEGVEDVTN